MTIIINTGGCKIGTCNFCSLPSYSSTTAQPLETIRYALHKFKPSSVALYNDGSVLNEDELEKNDLLSICDEFSDYGLRRLWIDTLPRFISSKLIDTIKKRSGVAELVVGMGLQVQGNRLAICGLGRPDPDCIFERAIQIINQAKSSVRIYLLWGYSFLSGQKGRILLERSIKWARRRRVTYITICPYVMPKPENAKKNRYELCELREILGKINFEGITLDVADWIAPPCGLYQATFGCPNCEKALSSDSWSTGGRCTSPSKLSLNNI